MQLNCASKHIREILKLRKLNFRGLNGQFDVKKDTFRGLIAKIDYLRPILASRTHVRSLFMEYAVGVVPYGMFERF